MKNILIIVANPKTTSLSFAIANKYKTLAEQAGHQVDMLDLYRCEHLQPFFTFEKYSKVANTPSMSFYQEKIQKADELVFVFPFWWGSMPAILKNFIDWNFSVNFAFRYTDSKPIGLLTGKQAKVFTTTGGPFIHYWITGAYGRLRKMLVNQIIGFCGMDLKEFNAFGGIDSRHFNPESVLSRIKI